MLRTIQVGSSVLIQGEVVGTMSDGRLVVQVGDKRYAGVPVPMLRAA